MASMRRTYLALLILLALLSLGLVTSCIVRTRPGPGRHSHGVERDHHKHSKHGKKPKKHKH
jgi:hypothetical protein